ncbi:MAG: ABC transporter permease, partial [Lentisphaerae bacterium]|nr:ABC transporter permease [Lentisphaerota bacterium]
LGALDGFIMIMFVLESCFMGIVGGVIGSILGGVIGLGRMLAAFGVNFLGAIPIGDIVVGMLMSVLLGTILAAVAAVLPSFKAARLAPMEAMRVE